MPGLPYKPSRTPNLGPRISAVYPILGASSFVSLFERAPSKHGKDSLGPELTPSPPHSSIGHTTGPDIPGFKWSWLWTGHYPDQGLTAAPPAFLHPAIQSLGVRWGESLARWSYSSKTSRCRPSPYTQASQMRRKAASGIAKTSQEILTSSSLTEISPNYRRRPEV